MTLESFFQQRCEIKGPAFKELGGGEGTSHNVMDLFCFFASGLLINARKYSFIQARKHNNHTHMSMVPFCDGLHVSE